MSAGQVNQLGAGRSLRRADGGSSKSGLILVADEDQQRTPYPGRIAAGPVEPEAQRGAGGDRLLPVRVPVVRVERSVAVEGVRRREERDGPRLATSGTSSG